MKNYTNTNIYSSHNSSRGQRFRQTVSNTMRCNGQCVLVHCQNLQMITQHSRHLIWTWSILYLWVWPPEQQQSHISNGEKLIKSAEMLPFNFRRAWRISEIVCNLVIILVLHSQSNSSSHTKWFFKIFPFNKFMTWVCASPTRIMYGSNSHTTVSSFIVVYVCMERSTLGHAHFVTTFAATVATAHSHNNSTVHSMHAHTHTKQRIAVEKCKYVEQLFHVWVNVWCQCRIDSAGALVQDFLRVQSIEKRWCKSDFCSQIPQKKLNTFLQARRNPAAWAPKSPLVILNNFWKLGPSDVMARAQPRQILCDNPALVWSQSDYVGVGCYRRIAFLREILEFLETSLFQCIQLILLD